ncbi:MAG: hypothetical protein FJX67_13790 [Alphaproteobacteria bacterium]|nr:hypothetical protein [Alphaproteobacteria bacterium]
MRYGFSEERARSRRRGRILFRGFRWSLVLALAVAIGYHAHEAGTVLAERDVVRLRDQVASLSTQVDALQADKSRLEHERTTASAEAEALRQRYEADVPTGAISELMRLARAKLSAGVEAQRLAAVLGSVENARNCDNRPVSKRFIVRTGPSTTGNDNVAFGDRTIKVTAEGQPTIDPSGRQQSWFDPVKPLTVRFVQIGGRATAASGTLPLHHSIVVNNTEHRFLVEAGDSRGFVTVTSDACRYP